MTRMRPMASGGTAILCCVLLAANFSACRKKNDGQFTLNGIITDASNGAGLGGVHVTLAQQVLSDGVFNSNYVDAAYTVSGAGGGYELSWPKAASATFRVTLDRPLYIGKVITLNPDEFTVSEPEVRNYSIHPEAFVRVRVWNEGDGEPSDVAGFTWANTDFDCACCASQWYEISGEQADTTWKCRLYGNSWLKYRTEISTSNGFSIDIDSIWCPAFDTTFLSIPF